MVMVGTQYGNPSNVAARDGLPLSTRPSSSRRIDGGDSSRWAYLVDTDTSTLYETSYKSKLWLGALLTLLSGSTVGLFIGVLVHMWL